MRMALISLAASLSVLSSCGSVTPTLPTLDSWGGGCRDVGLDVRLTGDPSDQRITWLTASSGQRIDVIWPPGYTARFTPNLEVLDANGNVAFREGSKVSGGCVTGPDATGPLLIASGF